MVDYYLQDPQRVKGTPKLTLGKYVEEQGFPVPRRFGSLIEALDLDVPFLARSEHPSEYDGHSGLLDSPWRETIMNKLKAFTPEALKKAVVGDRISDIEVYCHHEGIEVEEFIRAVSFSFWEGLPGYNRAVVADSSVAGRYHVATRQRGGIANFAVVEQGKVVMQEGDPLPQNAKKGLQGLIEFYEEIRTLSRFDPQHCPVVEVQTFDGTHYFLQYLRTRDLTAADFELRGPPDDHYVEATFVRGATPTEEGIVINATLIYARLMRGAKNITIPHDEEASFGFPRNPILYEVRARNRRVQIIEPPGRTSMLELIALGHVSRSMLFKPRMSVIIPKDSLVSPEERVALRERAEETGENQVVQIHLVSDGRKAYLRRIQ